MKNSTFVGSHARGFALVVTLSLMILLTIIAVGLLTLSTISLRSSSQGNAQATAQANARVALMLAIGDLQKQLGPDQRISITADQRPASSGDGSTSSSAIGNRHWTGVFDSWPASSETRPTPAFRSWLVSGDISQTSAITTAESALPATSSIELVGAGTLGAAITGQVKAPTVMLKANGNTAGRVAWWIGDQGVKASLATPPPSKDTSLAVLRNNLQAAPRNATELAKVGAVKPFGALAVDDPRMRLVTSWQQAGLLLVDPKSPRPLFHDLAASSPGLLTNVRSGGFRKDLSMKFETYTSPPVLTEPDNILYTVKSQITNKNEVGINFMELWGYYHLYKDLKYSGGLNYTTGGVVPAGAPYLQTKLSEQEIADDLWDRFKHPITINYQTIYSFEVAPHPQEAGNNVLWLNFDPVVTLWNPLDVAVDIPKHTTWNYLYSFWMIPYDINISINGGTRRACSILQTSNWKNDANFLKLNAGVVETITLKPGEVVKISQEGGTIVRNDRDQSVGGFQGFNGKKGFNYGGGYRVPLLDTSLQRIVVSPSDRISYTATPRVGSEGSNSQRFSLTQVNLELGGRGATNHGYMSVDSRSNYTRVQVGEVRNMNDQRSMPNPLDIKGNVHPEVYPSIEGPTMTRELSASALISDKATFMTHTYFVKTEEENLSEARMFSRFNPRAYSLDFYDFSKQERDMLPFETKVEGLTSWLGAPLDESVTGQGYFGSSLGAQFGSSFVTTHSVPRQPVVSLAALQNSFANGFNMASKPKGNNGQVLRGSSASMSYPLLPQISHAIGNSLAPSVIPLDQTTNNRAGYPHPLADHSYLANRELWDNYFLSGIAPQPQPAFATARDQKKVALDFFNNEKDLPVARYRPELGGTEAIKLVDSFFSGTIPTLESINKLAGYLRVDGMFNVNSTSLEAWKALLGSLKNRPIMVRSESGVESIKAADGNTPVANGGAPWDLITSDDSITDPGQWYGRRTLTDAEIESLAEGIVREVRKRGPFLSLADFVNRRVGRDKDLAKSGAIQSALDSSEVSINKKQNDNRAVTSLVANRFEFPEAEKGAMNYGAPSFVKQGDILTPIAPILSARSDSFIIRAYGEATDTKGNVLARAWCEAVVERSRDYVDSADNFDTLPTNLTRASNNIFGRRFNIVSFRWLNLGEI
jgi:Tfp pilus assembly protein PilX